MFLFESGLPLPSPFYWWLITIWSAYMFLDLERGEFKAIFLFGLLPWPVFIFLVTNFLFAGDSNIDAFLWLGLLNGRRGCKFLTIADLYVSTKSSSLSFRSLYYRENFYMFPPFDFSWEISSIILAILSCFGHTFDLSFENISISST